MMRTIFVVYTDDDVKNVNECKLKKYAFNVDRVEEIEVGDRLMSKSYNTSMVVTDVLNEVYVYYNNTNGDLSDTLKSTSMRKIKTLAIRNDECDVVYASIDKKIDES